MTGEVKNLEKNINDLKVALQALSRISSEMAPYCAELIDLLDDFLERWKKPEGKPEEAD